MIAIQLAALLLAASTGGDVVLLDFSADWCGPCRSMQPVVSQLEAAGYPVRKVNVDHERALAAQYHVQTIPCFVLVVNGKEVDRVSGAVGIGELQALFAKAQGASAPRNDGASAPRNDSAAAPRNDAASRPRGDSAPPRRRPSAAPSDALVTIARAQSPDPSVAGASVPAQEPPATLYNELNAAAAQASSATARAEIVPVGALLASSVRLTIEDQNGFSYGSGTLIDARGGDALVLTCGHIFRDSQGKGKISVELFSPQGSQKLAGRLVRYDLKRDIGLVSISPGAPVPVLRVCPKGHRLAKGDRVVSTGCNNGAGPTAEPSQVNSLDKFLGPANVQVAGQPVQGRSGGGLFDGQGFVVGVCNAADPADNEGLFAAASTIQAELDQADLTAIYDRPAGKDRLLASHQRPTPGLGATPNLPARMPAIPMRDGLAASFQRPPAGDAAGAMPQLTAEQRATLAELGQSAQGAEVICIVRPLSDPQGKSEIVVLDRASSAFLERLAAERSTQQGRHLTSLEVPRTGRVGKSCPISGTTPLR